MTPAEAAGQRLTPERLSLHSSAAQTGSARSSTHTMLLPATLLSALLIHSTVYHTNPLLSQVRGLSQAGRPESFFKNEWNVEKVWNKYVHADNNHRLSFRARNSKQMSFFAFTCTTTARAAAGALEGRGAGAKVHADLG